MRATFLLTMTLIAGCTTASSLTAPDGQPGFAISCNGDGNCYRKAGDVCPAGYNVFSGRGQMSGVVVPLANGGLLATSTKRSLIVSCLS